MRGELEKSHPRRKPHEPEAEQQGCGGFGNDDYACDTESGLVHTDGELSVINRVSVVAHRMHGMLGSGPDRFRPVAFEITIHLSMH